MKKDLKLKKLLDEYCKLTGSHWMVAISKEDGDDDYYLQEHVYDFGGHVFCEEAYDMKESVREMLKMLCYGEPKDRKLDTEGDA
jgi:hypothetical protein